MIPIIYVLLSFYFKQALEVIRELQKHYPIKRAPMRLRLTVPEQNISSLTEKLNGWDAKVVSRDESVLQISIVSRCKFAIIALGCTVTF